VSGAAPNEPVAEPPAAPAVESEPSASWQRPGVGVMLLTAWVLGAAVLGTLFLIQRARAIRALGRRQAVTDTVLLGMLADLRRHAGFRRPVRLTVASGLASPVALGGNEIVLPPVALAELGAAEQRSLLAHELAHLARRDPQWLAFGCLVERVFFFQPLNRIARHRLQEAAEYLCDDWAVRRTGSGDSLATCLVKVAEWVGTAPRPIPLAGIAERPSQLVTRVHRLIKGETMPTRSRTIWLGAGAFALVGFTAIAAPAITASPRAAMQSPAPAGEVQDTGDAALARTLRQARLAEMRAHTDARRAQSMARAEARHAGRRCPPCRDPSVPAGSRRVAA
jgi:beta-lactamase regulating signal transducer with metallopeptidase domain